MLAALDRERRLDYARELLEAAETAPQLDAVWDPVRIEAVAAEAASLAAPDSKDAALARRLLARARAAIAGIAPPPVSYGAGQ